MNLIATAVSNARNLSHAVSEVAGRVSGQSAEVFGIPIADSGKRGARFGGVERERVGLSHCLDRRGVHH